MFFFVSLWLLSCCLSFLSRCGCYRAVCLFSLAVVVVGRCALSLSLWLLSGGVPFSSLCGCCLAVFPFSLAGVAVGRCALFLSCYCCCRAVCPFRLAVVAVVLFVLSLSLWLLSGGVPFLSRCGCCRVVCPFPLAVVAVGRCSLLLCFGGVPCCLCRSVRGVSLADAVSLDPERSVPQQYVYPRSSALHAVPPIREPLFVTLASRTGGRRLIPLLAGKNNKN